MGRNEPLSWPKGLKRTKQRLVIIEALCETEKPLSVQEISVELLRRGNPMWLSTIYRVLETLIKHGIIQKSAMSDGGTALYEIGDEHRHYAVCVGCKSVIELEGCPIESILPGLQAKSFHVVGHKLQISGFCDNCYLILNTSKKEENK